MSFRGYAKGVAGVAALCGALAGVLVWIFPRSDVRAHVYPPVTVVSGVRSAPPALVRRNLDVVDDGILHIKPVEVDERKESFMRSAQGIVGKDWLPAKDDYDALYAEKRNDEWAQGLENGLNIFLSKYKFVKKDDFESRKIYCAENYCGIMMRPGNGKDYYEAGILANDINDDKFIEYLDRMGMKLSSVTSGGSDSGEVGVVISVRRK